MISKLIVMTIFFSASACSEYQEPTRKPFVAQEASQDLTEAPSPKSYDLSLLWDYPEDPSIYAYEVHGSESIDGEVIFTTEFSTTDETFDIQSPQIVLSLESIREISASDTICLKIRARNENGLSDFSESVCLNLIEEEQ